MKNFDELNVLELDTIREIGSIGTGNAATALSSMLGCEVRIDVPEVRIMGYNEAIDWIGGPEVITAGVVVRMGGEVNGIMLSVQQIEFVNLVLGHMVGREIEDYSQLTELERFRLGGSRQHHDLHVHQRSVRFSGPHHPGNGARLRGGHAGGDFDRSHGGIWRSVRLHYDDRRKFYLQSQDRTLPPAALTGYPLSKFFVEEAGCFG